MHTPRIIRIRTVPAPSAAPPDVLYDKRNSKTFGTEDQRQNLSPVAGEYRGCDMFSDPCRRHNRYGICTGTSRISGDRTGTEIVPVLFVYTMSQVQICACTRICTWRMYITWLLSEIVYKVYESSRSQPTRLSYFMMEIKLDVGVKRYFDPGILNYGGTEEDYGNKKITGFFKDSGTTEM